MVSHCMRMKAPAAGGRRRTSLCAAESRKRADAAYRYFKIGYVEDRKRVLARSQWHASRRDARFALRAARLLDAPDSFSEST